MKKKKAAVELLRRRCEEVYNKLSYKPGYVFCYGEIGRDFCIWIMATVNDSENPRNRFLLSGKQCILPLYADKDMILKEYADLVQRFEMHEMREFLRYNGKQIWKTHEKLTEENDNG